MRKRSLLIIIVTALTITLALFLSGRLSAPEAGRKASDFQDGDLVSLSGEIVCLQHADQGEYQTMECAFGLHVGSDTYYALQDTSSDYSILSTAPMNTTVHVEGTYRSSTDTKYNQNGTIEVTAISQ